MNVTVTAPSAPAGHITVYPDGTTLPTASNLNFTAGETVPNLVITPVGSDGEVDLYNGSAGTVQLVADVSGYFLGSGSGLGLARAHGPGPLPRHPQRDRRGARARPRPRPAGSPAR